MNIQNVSTAEVVANGRHYRIPTTPTVAVCIDGSEPGYIEAAIAAGLAPTIDRMMKTGSNLLAKSVIPSFTNPNNISIITGRPPAVHGIAGNYFYDTDAREEVMMNDVRFMRADTIMKAFQDAGAKVAVVTAKDKLRTLLGKGLDPSTGRAIAFSSEKADKATKAENGIGDLLQFVGMSLPEVYSADLSEFVFAAGVKLMQSFRPDVMYLSTTDYIQHKAAPGSEVANSFYAMIDRYIAQLDAMGCVVALTADHGMNDKHLANGEPDVIYLQDWCDKTARLDNARVILPITDPYVAHHGALGSLRPSIFPKERTGRRSSSSWRCSMASSWRFPGGCMRALRAPGRPDRRYRCGFDAAQSHRHKSRPARSLRSHRAAAVAWRIDRAGGSHDRQSQTVDPRRAPAE